MNKSLRMYCMLVIVHHCFNAGFYNRVGGFIYVSGLLLNKVHKVHLPILFLYHTLPTLSQHCHTLLTWSHSFNTVTLFQHCDTLSTLWHSFNTVTLFQHCATLSKDQTPSSIITHFQHYHTLSTLPHTFNIVTHFQHYHTLST